MSAPLQCHFPLDTRTRAHACTGTGQHRQGAGSRRRTAHKTSLRIIQIGKADELPVHNRKWVGNQTNRGGYIW